MMKTTLRILNLEDSPLDAKLNHAMLSARWPHCEFTRLDSREDFIASLERGDFDLILSDYTMPGFGGREALALAREKRPEIPFLFVSGTIGEDTAIEALKNGATDYVLKDRLLRLIPAVDRALRETEAHAECQRTDEAMRQSEHKYHELFEYLSDAGFLTDELTGKIIDANRRAETLLGCTRGEILGRYQSQFLGLDEVGQGADQSQTDAPTTSTFACELVRKNGSVAPVVVHATRLTIHGRALVLRLCHDINRP